MAKYSIEGSTLTAIADGVRGLVSTNGMTPSDMATNLQGAAGTVDGQAELLAQVQALLEGKAFPEAPELSVFKATAKLSANNQQISFTGLSAQPKAFAVTPAGDIALSTSNRFVVNVLFDGTTTHGVYCYGSGSSWSATYTAAYSASYFTHTYSNGTLTLRTSSTTNGGYFSSNVTYELIAIW